MTPPISTSQTSAPPVDARDEIIARQDEKIAELMATILMHEHAHLDQQEDLEVLWNRCEAFKEEVDLLRSELESQNQVTRQVRQEISEANTRTQNVTTLLNVERLRSCTLDGNHRAEQARKEGLERLVAEKDLHHRDLRDTIRTQRSELSRKDREIDRTYDFADLQRKSHEVGTKISVISLDKDVCKSTRVSRMRDALEELRIADIESLRDQRGTPRIIKDRCHELLRCRRRLSDTIDKFARTNGHEFIDGVTQTAGQLGMFGAAAGLFFAGPAALPFIGAGAAALVVTDAVNSGIRSLTQD